MNYEFVEPNSPRWLSLEDIRKYFGMKDRMDIYGVLCGNKKKYLKVLFGNIMRR